MVSHNEARSYGWDRANRLTLVSGEMESGEYEDVYYGYDPSGRLIDRERLYDHPEKRYYADGLSPILVKRWDGSLNSGAGGWKTLRTAMIIPGVIGHVAAEREATAWNGSGAATAFTDRHYHYDLLGNTVLETGTNAAVLARTEMEAYGEMVRESNSAGTWESQPSNSSGNRPNAVLGATNRPRQTTKKTDPDTGLRWFGARWYDTGLGGWISPEPLGLDGPNMYNAMGQSPAYYVDPDGAKYGVTYDDHTSDAYETGHDEHCAQLCLEHCNSKGLSVKVSKIQATYLKARKTVKIPLIPKNAKFQGLAALLPKTFCQSEINKSGIPLLQCACACQTGGGLRHQLSASVFDYLRTYDVGAHNPTTPYDFPVTQSLEDLYNKL